MSELAAARRSAVTVAVGVGVRVPAAWIPVQALPQAAASPTIAAAAAAAAEGAPLAAPQRH
eukprot:scaffold85021_cov18-Tisochrysis_lutea.AAC.1